MAKKGQGRQIGIWFNDEESAVLVSEIEESGKSASTFLKDRLTERDEFKTALLELYEFMTNTMEFSNEPSHSDKKFIEKTERILGVE